MQHLLFYFILLFLFIYIFVKSLQLRVRRHYNQYFYSSGGGIGSSNSSSSKFQCQSYIYIAQSHAASLLRWVCWVTVEQVRLKLLEIAAAESHVSETVRHRVPDRRACNSDGSTTVVSCCVVALCMGGGTWHVRATVGAVLHTMYI